MIVEGILPSTLSNIDVNLRKMLTRNLHAPSQWSFDER